MAQKGITTLLAEIIAKVFQNTSKSVTGQDVQDVMVDMTDSLNQSTYSASIAYNIGQSVIFDNTSSKDLYECISSTSAGESPTTNPAKWDKITGGMIGSSGILITRAEVLYTNTAQTTIISLPTDAVVSNIGIEVITAFDDTGSDNIIIGTTAEDDRYNTGENASIITSPIVREALFGNMTGVTANYADRITATTNVTFTYTGQNADATQGQAFVYVYYSLH